MNEELEKFHIQLLENVIEVIKTNQASVDKINRDNNDSYHKGAISFGDVIIHEIRNEIRKIRKSDGGRT